MSKAEESKGISIFKSEYVLLNKNLFRFWPVTSFQIAIPVVFEELIDELSNVSLLIDSIEILKKSKLVII